MNKRIIIIILILILTFSFAVSGEGQWNTFTSEDEMTESKIWFANSPYVSPTEKMDFPYGDVEASLHVGYDGEREWAYIAFRDTPNIMNSEPGDGYNIIYTRIKWDDEIENIKLTQKWSSRFIHFKDDENIISNIINSNTALLELDWYGEEEVYFKFPLDGSAAAIEKIRNSFDKD